ncbi:hypothetical protein AXE80_10380 [Wenyingzhuangia fucanilytica]|uniref:Sialate O-acetylesterase domain-containing protein n=2 Tax=Wenyingzhuangia fucanilytica TaxID=1790137 RepID=A0A1B1Y7B0_9FLAO|nr:hypothetical protein AXE80_10380 [Wenyingzhuangia fucanilytica]
MAGRATIEDIDKDTLANVLLFTGQEHKAWEKAANPFNKYSTVRKEMRMQKLSPSYGFAKTMAQENPSSTIGLIVNAKGGTSIEAWKPGGLLYSEAISQTKKALKTGGVLKGIIWHQGEANSSRYKKYTPQIIALIQALRTDLNQLNLPVVVGQLSSDKPLRNNFNKMILELPNHINNVAVVTTEGLSTIDKTHFDSKSQRILGQRYANEMLKLLAKK